MRHGEVPKGSLELDFAPADIRSLTSLWSFSTAELTIGVICACLPACNILIAQRRNAVAPPTESSYFSSSSRFMYAIKSIKFLRTKTETVHHTTIPVTFTNANATTLVNTRATVLGLEEPHPGTNVVDIYLGSYVTPPSTTDENGSSRTRNNYLTSTNNSTPNRTNVDVSTGADTDVERGGH